MAEYIEKENVLDALDELLVIDPIWEAVKRIPAADVAPVRHGRWEEIGDGDGDSHWRCSSCGCEWFFEVDGPVGNGSSYCPHCGAKMDGEALENEA